MDLCLGARKQKKRALFRARFCQLEVQTRKVSEAFRWNCRVAQSANGGLVVCLVRQRVVGFLRGIAHAASAADKSKDSRTRPRASNARKAGWGASAAAVGDLSTGRLGPVDRSASRQSLENGDGRPGKSREP